jgi:cytochrome c553
MGKGARRWGCVAAVMLAFCASEAGAYPTWSVNPVNNTGYCADCHGNFNGGIYTSRTADDPVSWGENLMNGHDVRYGLGCDDCHDEIFRAPVALNSSISGVTCATCHGREEDITPNDGASGGPGPGRGDGLRAYHELKVGTGTCAGCHTADTTPVAEDVAPATFLAKGIDPCDESGTAGPPDFGLAGLDNDGNGLRDAADPICPLPTSTTTTTLPPPLRIAGRSLLIRNKLPNNKKKNKIVLVAPDSHVAAGEIGSSADPRCAGAGGSGSGGSLTVSSQTSGQSHTTDLPCVNWTRMGKNPGAGSVPKGYRYTDKELNNGTCKVVMIKHGKLVKALCIGKGTDLNYNLQAGQLQAPVKVVLTTGRRRHCMQFGLQSGARIRKDGTNGKAFKATKASAPQSCP